jgi:hypothetical protein
MLPSLCRTMLAEDVEAGGKQDDVWRMHHGVTAMTSNTSTATVTKPADASLQHHQHHRYQQHHSGSDNNSTPTPPPPPLSPVIIMSEFSGSTGSCCNLSCDHPLQALSGATSFQQPPRLLVPEATPRSSTSSQSCLSVPGSGSSFHGGNSAPENPR